MTLTLGISPISEVVLFSISVPKYVVPRQIYKKDNCRPQGAQLHRLKSQISSLEGVNKRHPGKIADGEHESEAVCGDVHGSKDSGLQQI